MKLLKINKFSKDFNKTSRHVVISPPPLPPRRAFVLFGPHIPLECLSDPYPLKFPAWFGNPWKEHFRQKCCCTILFMAKLFMCLISIVTRSNSHLVREMNQNPGSTHCFILWKTLQRRGFGEFSRSHTALDAFYWLHKVISISLSRFGEAKVPFSLCLYVYFSLRRVKEICSW